MRERGGRGRGRRAEKIKEKKEARRGQRAKGPGVQGHAPKYTLP